MHPQPELGIAADVHFENVGAALRELADGIGIVGGRRIDRMLVDHAEAAVRQRQGEYRHHRGAGTKCQRRQRGRRRCRTIEEVDVDRVDGLDVLIDEHRDAFVRFERAQHAANRAAAIDDRVAGLHPRRLEQAVQQRIVQRPRQHRHWIQRDGVHQGVDLPEPEVPREEQRALPLRVRGADAILALERHARKHLRPASSC